MTAASSPLVVLAAGGSGGHVFPAEALAVQLADRGCRLALITDRRGGAFSDSLANVETHRVLASGVAGKSFMRRLKSAPELAIGTWQARQLLKRLNPAVVIGFGGYASIPTLLAAHFGGYSTAIHEQNAVLGRANRLLAARTSRIATSFESVDGMSPESERKVVRTGMPVRPAIGAVRDQPYPTLDDRSEVSILVVGGSQGARVLSDVVPVAMARLDEGIKQRLHVTQQCRPEDLERVRDVYAQSGVDATLDTFFADIPERLTQAHLVISRAGASTVAEITAVGRPAILVPYPHAIDNHQDRNAHAVDAAGAGWLMPEDAFDAASLAGRLDSLIGLPAILVQAAQCSKSAGRADAADALADMVMEMIPAGGDNSSSGSSDRRHAA